MNELTYDEHFRRLNRESLMKMISNMTEVPTLKVAQEVGARVMNNIAETSGLSKAKLRKSTYALAKITYQDSNYIAFIYNINGAMVMLRATNLDTKKLYIPNEVWVAMTNSATEESELILVMSLDANSIP